MKTFIREEIPTIELESETSARGRFYVTPTGARYPSFTTILGAMQSEEKKAVLAKWKARVGEQQAAYVSKRATDRGTSMHTICENYTCNFANPTRGHMPTSIELFKHIQPVLDERVGTIYGNEIALFSERLRAAGRTDLVAQFDGIRSVVDFKTSTKDKKEEWITDYFLQSTAYAIMLEEMYDHFVVPQIAIIIAVEDGEHKSQVFVKRTADYREQVLHLFDEYNRLYTQL